MSQAVILAGGKSSRLAAVTGGLPKPLVPVAGVPILERQLALLADCGIVEVFVTTGYRARDVERHLSGRPDPRPVVTCVAEERPLGTAGGLYALRDRLTGDFVVMYGDILADLDLRRLLAFHRRSGATATLVVHPNDHPADSDLVALDADQRVSGFHPAPRAADCEHRNLVSAAVYVLAPAALDHLQPGVEQDFIRDVFPRLLAAGEPVYGYRTTEYLRDMGTPERLARVERDVHSGHVRRCRRDHPRPALFLDRDGVVNAEVGGVLRPEQLELLPGAAAAVRRCNQAGWLVGVVSNQPDLAKGRMSEEDLERVQRRLECRLGEAGAWIDETAYCPHHPERGHAGERPELKIECRCRKPAPGLLERIAARLPVDRRPSVLVGDNWRDHAAAHAFGVDAIGVRSSRRWREPAPPGLLPAARPDVLVDDLAQAVALVLDPDPEVEALADRAVELRSGGAPDRAFVLVGGLSRAGKSVTVFRLRRALAARGLEGLVVRLDDWILPAGQRPRGSTLTQRYRRQRLLADLGELGRGRAVEAPGYDPLTRGPAGAVIYDPRAADLLLVDGVPALLFAPGGATCLKVDVSAPDERTRRRRLDRFYAAKGLAPDEVADLLDGRGEEHEAVLAAARSADYHLQPAPLDLQPGSARQAG